MFWKKFDGTVGRPLIGFEVWWFVKGTLVVAAALVVFTFSFPGGENEAFNVAIVFGSVIETRRVGIRKQSADAFLTGKLNRDLLALDIGLSF